MTLVEFFLAGIFGVVCLIAFLLGYYLIPFMARFERSAKSLEESSEKIERAAETVMENQDIIVGERLIINRLELSKKIESMKRIVFALMQRFDLYDYSGNGQGKSHE